MTNLTVSGTLNGQSITFPSSAGEIITTGSIDKVTNNMMAISSIGEEQMRDDSISSTEMKTLSTLLIKNSSGSTLKTLHGAGV